MSWFCGPSSDFKGWMTKTAIVGKIFKALEWQLTIPQLGGRWEIKNNSIHH